MTNIPIFIHNNKVCYQPATSQRDTIANITILLPSRRILHPTKHYTNCIDIEEDKIAIKFYRSNRGVPYLLVYKLETQQVVADLREHLNPFVIKAVLKELGAYEEDIEFVIKTLELE